ncbi:MAG: ribonuclease H-like domain-containing protein [bacterium]|nr:ribonuclease H-like domain-containing protein [bacterium]
MRKFPVMLDLETKYTFREFNDPKKLGISVVAIYDYGDNQEKIYTESELSKLFPILERCSYVMGYNINSFDMAVLQGYYPGDTTRFSTFDILDDIKEKIGRRLALNDVINATLGKKKTGHGLMAIDYYKEGKWAELKKYCMDDVLLTKELFEYGMKTGEIYYMNEIGKMSIKVDWRKYLEESGDKEEIPLTLPF